MVHLSPLTALTVDIHAKLEGAVGRDRGGRAGAEMQAGAITVAVRTGDSTSSERQTMVRRPPDLLVAT